MKQMKEATDVILVLLCCNKTVMEMWPQRTSVSILFSICIKLKRYILLQEQVFWRIYNNNNNNIINIHNIRCVYNSL